MMLQIKCQGSKPYGFRQGFAQFLNVSPRNLCDRDIQRIRTIFHNSKEGHRSIIHAKFSQNLARGEALILSTTDDSRRMMDDGHPMITIAHLEPLAQVR